MSILGFLWFVIHVQAQVYHSVTNSEITSHMASNTGYNFECNLVDENICILIKICIQVKNILFSFNEIICPSRGNFFIQSIFNYAFPQQ